MVDLLVMKDLVDDFSGMPRDVTLFGELGMLGQTDGRDYDLFFCSCEGIGHAPGAVDARFQPLPVFLWPGSESTFLQKVHEYAKQHDNKYVGVCGPDELCFYHVTRRQDGTEVEALPFIPSIDRAKLLETVHSAGWKEFGREVEVCTAAITDCWIRSARRDCRSC